MKFARTRIYEVALEVTRVSQRLGEYLPAYLADQLRRAAASICLNFAEGSGKTGERHRRRFFLIARGSTYEVAAVADVALALGLIASAEADALRDHCDHLSGMLWRYR